MAGAKMVVVRALAGERTGDGLWETEGFGRGRAALMAATSSRLARALVLARAGYRDGKGCWKTPDL